MARSFRRNPITGITTAASEKHDKQLARRRHRHRVRRALAQDPKAAVLPSHRETSDPWSMAKDGKARFDPLRFPELLRK